MKKIHVMWNLFAITGNIHAYLLYKDWQCKDEEQVREGRELKEKECLFIK
jgi:hypothetical protein